MTEKTKTTYKNLLATLLDMIVFSSTSYRNAYPELFVDTRFLPSSSAIKNTNYCSLQCIHKWVTRLVRAALLLLTFFRFWSNSISGLGGKLHLLLVHLALIIRSIFVNAYQFYRRKILLDNRCKLAKHKNICSNDFFCLKNFEIFMHF